MPNTNKKSQKKILVVGPNFKSLAGLRLPLLQSMQQLGHEVYACAGEYDEKSAKRLEKNNIHWKHFELRRTSLNPWTDIQFFFALLRYMHEKKADILFAYTIKSIIYSSLAGWLCRVKNRHAMISGLGYAFMEKKEWKQKCIYYLACFLYKVSLGFNKTIFFQNPDDLSLFKHLRLVSPKKTSVVIPGSGVDIQAFPFVPLPQKPIRFLLIARLISDKGIFEYVDACRLIKKRHPEVQFDLLAPPDANPNGIDEDSVKKWEQENILNYYGEWVDDVRPFLAKSSIYVLPSYYPEGTPRSTLDAMAMGRPIITTNMPGCRETISLKNTDNRKKNDIESLIEGTNGFLIPPKRADILAQAMEAFIKHPEKIEKMGKCSRIIAEEKYDVRKVNEIILKNIQLLPLLD